MARLGLQNRINPGISLVDSDDVSRHRCRRRRSLPPVLPSATVAAASVGCHRCRLHPPSLRVIFVATVACNCRQPPPPPPEAAPDVTAGRCRRVGGGSCRRRRCRASRGLPSLSNPITACRCRPLSTMPPAAPATAAGRVRHCHVRRRQLQPPSTAAAAVGRYCRHRRLHLPRLPRSATVVDPNHCPPLAAALAAAASGRARHIGLIAR